MDATEVVIGTTSVGHGTVPITPMTRRRLLNVETNKVIKRVILDIVLVLTGRTTIHTTIQTTTRTTTRTTTIYAIANALVDTPNLVIFVTLVTDGIREIVDIREIDICTRRSRKSMKERIFDSDTIIDRHFYTRQTC